MLNWAKGKKLGLPVFPVYARRGTPRMPLFARTQWARASGRRSQTTSRLVIILSILTYDSLTFLPLSLDSHQPNLSQLSVSLTFTLSIAHLSVRDHQLQERQSVWS